MLHEYPTTTKYSMTFWPFAQAVNYSFVPLHLRTIYVNSLMVLWNAYLSLTGYRNLESSLSGTAGERESF